MTQPIKTAGQPPKFVGLPPDNGWASDEATVMPPMGMMRKLHFTKSDMNIFDADLKRPEHKHTTEALGKCGAQFRCHQGRVELCGEVMAINKDNEVVERQRVGAEYEVAWKHNEISWPTTYPGPTTEIQLAPAFAGLANAWLDRSLVTTLASALAWSGISRASELDPQARTAMRVAATTPIELTRYYVRAYAMLISAAACRDKGTEYRPRPVENMRHISAEADSLVSWSGALTTCALAGGAGLFFDTHSLSHIDDLFNILALITAPRLTNASVASWLWPSIPGAVLYTNQSKQVRLIDTVPFELIEQGISWLISSTNTAAQAEQAKLLVMQLAMRPLGQGVFGTQLLQKNISIALPKAQTAGQMLLPFTLWASTNEFAPIGPNQDGGYKNMLRSAAILGASFTYSMQLAASQAATPTWWSKKHIQAYSRREANSTLVRNGKWFVAHAAYNIREKLGPFCGSMWSVGIWPHSKKTAIRLTRGLHDTAHPMALLSECCLSADPNNARFLKTTINEDMLVVQYGVPMLVRHLLTNVDSAAAAASLVAAGAKVGYADVSPATQTISSLNWAKGSRQLTGALFPDDGASRRHTRHIIVFDTANDYINTLAILKRRREATWFASHASENEMDAIDQETALDTPLLPRQRYTGKATGVPREGGKEEGRHGDDSDSDDSNNEGATGSQTSEPSSHQADETYIPTVIRELAKTDEVIQTTVLAAEDPTGPRIRPSTRALEGWRMPPSIVYDNTSLKWLYENIRTYFASVQRADPTGSLQHAYDTIGEQIRLNDARVMEASIPSFGQVEEIGPLIDQTAAAVLGKGQPSVGAVAGISAEPTAVQAPRLGQSGLSTIQNYATDVSALQEFQVATTD